MFRLILKSIIALALIFSTNVYAAADKAATEEKKTVKVYKVQTTEIYDIYKYPVVLEAKYERDLYSEITGFVHDIHVTVGEWVKKDETLMHLKPTGVFYTDEAFTVKSPINGQITHIDKKIGSHIKPGDLLIHIVEPNDLTIKIEVPQAELGLLRVKQQGEAKFRVIPNFLPIIVTGISSLIDQATGTSTGQLDWDKQNFKADELDLIKKHIYPGMLGYVTFKLNKRTGIKIPSQAILHEKEVDKVRIVKAGKAIRQIIKTGKHLEAGFIEITDGLQIDDAVIVTTGKYIKENEEVLIQEDEP